MTAIKIFNFLVLLTSAGLVFGSTSNNFIEKEEASEFLLRNKRGNTFIEELFEGNIEQECLEETCDYEEAREAFENDEQTRRFWNRLTDRCSSHPCNRIGTFRCKNTYNGYQCLCKPRYVGRMCETKTKVDQIYVCKLYLDLCENNGTCVDDEDDTYYCDCPLPWSGKDCSQDYDECEDDICVNGLCVNTFGGFRCECFDGYQGTLCETEQP